MNLLEQAKAALELVRNEPVIAYDTETSGVDWKRNQPVGYVITKSVNENYYIPVRHGGGGNLADPNVPPLQTPTDKSPQHWFEKELAEAFRERIAKGFLTIGHNLKFDKHFSANQGIDIGRNCEDTSINEPMLDEHQKSYSLESCAARRGVTAKKGEELYQHMARLFGCKADRNSMEHFWRLAGNDPIAVEYALGDGVTTLELREAQYPLLIEKDAQGNSMEFIHSVESRLIHTLFRMERRGWRVDEQYIDHLRKAIEEEIEEARGKFPAGFNERSPTDTRKAFENAGITNWPTTARGAPSFTEKFLKQSDVGKAIMTIRQLSNLLSKFVDPLKDRHMFEGRVHANLNQLKSDDSGTISGRLSCSDPNLQAVTKRNKKLGPRFRRCFIADPGYDLYENDYSQCEPRLFGHYSNEPALIKGYSANPPRDMHAVVADMLQVERDPTAKRMNMGILTGMQKKTFAEHMDWPLEKASKAFDDWFRGFPGIKTFQNKAKAAILSRGYVRTILGRFCRLDDVRFAYKATSKIIQGGNADIIKLKLLLIDMWLEEMGDVAHLIMTIHDSIIFQAPKGPEGEAIAAKIMEIATDVQSAPINLRLPFVMDSGKGDNWAEATYGPDAVKEAA